MIGTKRQRFLFDMVRADIYSARTFDLDMQAEAISNQILTAFPNYASEEDFIYHYAQALIYTKEMEFEWLEDAPEEFTNLQRFWLMRESGVSEIECFNFYKSNISNPVTNAWRRAITDAHVIWKPSEQKMISNITEAEKEADPNLSPATMPT